MDSGNDHQRGSFQKFVKAEFGPTENLLIVASHANEPPVIKKVVTIALGIGFKRGSFLPDFINENPVKIRRPGIKYLGWKWTSLNASIWIPDEPLVKITIKIKVVNIVVTEKIFWAKLYSDRQKEE